VVPPLADLFGHVALTPIYWIGLGVYAPALYVVDRMRKSVARRAARGRLPAAQGGVRA